MSAPAAATERRDDDSLLGRLVAGRWLPDWVLRLGIRRILADRLAEERRGGGEEWMVSPYLFARQPAREPPR